MIKLALTLALAFFAQAEHLKDTKPPRLTIKKGAEITVAKFYPEKNAFNLEMPKYTAQGPNYVTPDDLQTALDLPGPLPEFIKKMQKEPGQVFLLKTPVLLMDESEFAKRKAPTK